MYIYITTNFDVGNPITLAVEGIPVVITGTYLGDVHQSGTCVNVKLDGPAGPIVAVNAGEVVFAF